MIWSKHHHRADRQYEGGALSEPAKQYPSVFGGIKLFEDFPYALATICIGLFGLSAALVAIFFIKEVSIN